jgi:hypothetical protein
VVGRSSVLSVEGFIFVGTKLAQLVCIAVIPLIYGRIGQVALGHIRNEEYVAIPVLVRLSHLNGMLIGLALLYFSPHAAYYGMERVFTDPGPWSIDFTNFFVERANPLTYHWHTLVEAVRRDEGGMALRVYMSLSGFLLVLVIALSFFYWLPRIPSRASSIPVAPKPRFSLAATGFWPLADALRSIIVSYGVTVWTTYLTIYLINTLYWGMNLMNFWFLLLVAFVYQNIRYAHRS